MSQIQMSAQDVKVKFKHNGKSYGDDRFIIQMAPGDVIEDKIEEKITRSRYAIEGIDFELEIECREVKAA